VGDFTRCLERCGSLIVRACDPLRKGGLGSDFLMQLQSKPLCSKLVCNKDNHSVVNTHIFAVTYIIYIYIYIYIFIYLFIYTKDICLGLTRV